MFSQYMELAHVNLHLQHLHLPANTNNANSFMQLFQDITTQQLCQNDTTEQWEEKNY